MMQGLDFVVTHSAGSKVKHLLLSFYLMAKIVHMLEISIGTRPLYVTGYNSDKVV